LKLILLRLISVLDPPGPGPGSLCQCVVLPKYSGQEFTDEL